MPPNNQYDPYGPYGPNGPSNPNNPSNPGIPNGQAPYGPGPLPGPVNPYQPDGFQQAYQPQPPAPSQQPYADPYATYGNPAYGSPEYGYPDYTAAQPARSNRTQLLIAAILGTAFLLIVGIVIAAVISGNNAGNNAAGQPASGDELFQAALVNAMSSKSVTIASQGDDYKEEYQVDVANVSQPVLSGSIDSTSQSLDIAVKGYATAKDTYINLQRSKLLMGGNPEALNKWVQVRTNGKSTDTNGTGGNLLELFFSAPVLPLQNSDWPIGNYSESQRQELLSLINEKTVYRYDAKAVTETTHDGKKAMAYKVTVDDAALEELFRKAAAMGGASDADINAILALASLNDVQSEAEEQTYLIDVDSKQFVKAEYQEDGFAKATIYSRYGQTKTANKPADAYPTWDSFYAAFDKPVPVVVQ